MIRSDLRRSGPLMTWADDLQLSQKVRPIPPRLEASTKKAIAHPPGARVVSALLLARLGETLSSGERRGSNDDSTCPQILYVIETV